MSPPLFFRTTPRRLVCVQFWREVKEEKGKKMWFDSCHFSKKQTKKDGNFFQFFFRNCRHTELSRCVVHAFFVQIYRTLLFNYYIWQRNPPSPLFLTFFKSFFFQLKIKCPCKLLRNEEEEDEDDKMWIKGEKLTPKTFSPRR